MRDQRRGGTAEQECEHGRVALDRSLAHSGEQPLNDIRLRGGAGDVVRWR